MLIFTKYSGQKSMNKGDRRWIIVTVICLKYETMPLNIFTEPHEFRNQIRHSSLKGFNETLKMFVF